MTTHLVRFGLKSVGSQIEMSYSFVSATPAALQGKKLEPVRFIDENEMLDELKVAGITQDRPLSHEHFNVTSNQLRMLGFRQVP